LRNPLGAVAAPRLPFAVSMARLLLFIVIGGLLLCLTFAGYGDFNERDAQPAGQERQPGCSED